MKLHNKSFFALFVVGAAFLSAVAVSCNKSNNSTVSGQMSFSINGTAWTSNIPVQAIYSQSGNVFEVLAGYYKTGDTTALALQFTTPFVLHTAFSSDTTSLDVGYVNSTPLTQYDGGQITGHSALTISSWDSVNHKISGTFSGVLYNISGGTDSLVITNGSFSTGYTPQ